MKYNFVSDDSFPVKEFLDRYLPLSKEKRERLLTSGEVKINGIKAKKADNVIKGDAVSVFIPNSFGLEFPRIIYEDDNVLIADKPVGYETETSLKYFLEEEHGKLFPVHRLDRNTTGLVILAKNALAETELGKAIKNRKIKKYYMAWVNEALDDYEAELTAYLIKTDKGVKIYSEPKPNSKKIITRYKTIKTVGDKTLVEVQLVTGRTHQIRAHFAFIGHSIVGDSRYGDGNGYQKLRAYKLVLDGLNKLSYLNGKVFVAEIESFSVVPT